MDSTKAASKRPRPALPAELSPESVVAIIDTREQLAFDLSPLTSKPGTLATGDYSVDGLQHLIAIERKSLEDLVCCVGAERERFDREIQRLLGYPTRAIVVEAAWAHLCHGGWRSKATPEAVTSSVLSWIARGVPIILAGTRLDAQNITAKILYLAARHRYRELRSLTASMEAAV